MKNEIINIYKLINSPLITPYNLLENALLDNYSYVKYYTDDSYFVTEMSCNLDDGSEKIFYYYFKDTYMLQYIFCNESNKKVCIFDRDKEISTSKELFVNNFNKTFNESAI